VRLFRPVPVPGVVRADRADRVVLAAVRAAHVLVDGVGVAAAVAAADAGPVVRAAPAAEHRRAAAEIANR
jgi:hypothetical protein